MNLSISKVCNQIGVELKPLNKMVEMQLEDKRAATTTGILMRCLSNESRFKISFAEGELGGKEVTPFGLGPMRSEILEGWVMLEC